MAEDAEECAALDGLVLNVVVVGLQQLVVQALRVLVINVVVPVDEGFDGLLELVGQRVCDGWTGEDGLKRLDGVLYRAAFLGQRGRRRGEQEGVRGGHLRALRSGCGMLRQFKAVRKKVRHSRARGRDRVGGASLLADVFARVVVAGCSRQPQRQIKRSLGLMELISNVTTPSGSSNLIDYRLTSFRAALCEL